MRLLKLTLGWIIGVMGYDLILSLWQNKELDWSGDFQFIIVGFIGLLIGLGLRHFFKNKD